MKATIHINRNVTFRVTGWDVDWLFAWAYTHPTLGIHQVVGILPNGRGKATFRLDEVTFA